MPGNEASISISAYLYHVTLQADTVSYIISHVASQYRITCCNQYHMLQADTVSYITCCKPIPCHMLQPIRITCCKPIVVAMRYAVHAVHTNDSTNLSSCFLRRGCICTLHTVSVWFLRLWQMSGKKRTFATKSRTSMHENHFLRCCTECADCTLLNDNDVIMMI